MTGPLLVDASQRRLTRLTVWVLPATVLFLLITGLGR